VSELSEEVAELLAERADHVIEYSVRRRDSHQLQLSPDDVDRLVAAARHVRGGTGQSSGSPFSGLDVRLAHALLRVLRLRFVGQSARFDGDTVLDRLECTDTFLDDPVVLWFRVPAPESTDDELEEDLADILARFDEDGEQ